VRGPDEHRWKRGIEAWTSYRNVAPDELPAWLAEHLGERFGREAGAAASGASVDDHALSRRDHSLVVIALLVTHGDVDDQLRGYVRWALENGATPDELDALVTLLAVYARYPGASVAIEVVRDEAARTTKWARDVRFARALSLRPSGLR
jgi:alkylhydroperoxidase/carboxymuconolactone decarboxylase family protein YurZ